MQNFREVFIFVVHCARTNKRQSLCSQVINKATFCNRNRLVTNLVEWTFTCSIVVQKYTTTHWWKWDGWYSWILCNTIQRWKSCRGSMILFHLDEEKKPKIDTAPRGITKNKCPLDKPKLPSQYIQVELLAEQCKLSFSFPNFQYKILKVGITHFSQVVYKHLAR